MSSASMYIDHFVNDMLDYSILSKGGEKLEKSISKFDVRKSISEILEIQEDKIEMKNIDVQTKFNGFSEMFKICTDKRRF
jgi:signal transduction histidine kinase